MSHERADSVKQAQYDHWHEAMSLGEESKSPLTFPWYARVALELSLYKGGNLLEIGCGRGSFALWLASQRAMFHITGVDFSRTAIEIARARAQKSDLPVTFVEGDAESLPFSKETFDVVVSCECMEHVANPQLMACEMARVLKAGGKFILRT
jgi:ubiquinone/menaquinone biosynthesis C-methylase UbiE